MHKALEEKEQLLSALPPELQKAIERLTDMQLEAAAIAERDAFLMGFRLAVQLMADALAHPSGAEL